MPPTNDLSALGLFVTAPGGGMTAVAAAQAGHQHGVVFPSPPSQDVPPDEQP